MIFTPNDNDDWLVEEAKYYGNIVIICCIIVLIVSVTIKLVSLLEVK